MTRYVIIVLFLVLSVFLYIGLSHDNTVPSPLIGKPAPAFVLQQLHEPAKQFSPDSMKGKVWLFNLWASWCVSCREEHPVLMALSQHNIPPIKGLDDNQKTIVARINSSQLIVPIIGLDYKDKTPDAEAWLAKGGNPYLLNATDPEGRIGIDYGITGVPETFVIDKHGVIRYKEVGVVTLENLQRTILPLVAKLEQEP